MVLISDDHSWCSVSCSKWVEHDRSINDYVLNAYRFIERSFVSSGVDNTLPIKDDEICPVSWENPAPITQAKSSSRQRRHPPNRFFHGKQMNITRVST